MPSGPCPFLGFIHMLSSEKLMELLKMQLSFPPISYTNHGLQPGPLHGDVQLLSRVQLFTTPWTAACQASLSFSISWSLLKFMSLESVMLSNHFILCCPLLLLPSIFPSIKVFSNESSLRIRWPKASASATVLPMNIQGWFPLGLTDWALCCPRDYLI